MSIISSVDPVTKKYPELTPYQFAENSPVAFIDLDGLEKALPWYLRENKNGGSPVLTLGLPNLPTATKADYGEQPWYSDQAIATFAHNTAVAAWNGISTTWNDALDGKTGTDMLNESVNTLADMRGGDFKKVETYENIGGMLLTAYLLKKIGGGEVKFGAELPPGTKAAGLFSRASNLVKKVSEFKLTYSVEAITKSADYKIISKLTDQELINSAVKPKDYKMITVNTETGTLFDGNTRIYELQRRGLNDVQVPYTEYNPDNSMFPELKEPPKKK